MSIDLFHDFLEMENLEVPEFMELYGEEIAELFETGSVTLEDGFLITLEVTENCCTQSLK